METYLASQPLGSCLYFPASPCLRSESRINLQLTPKDSFARLSILAYSISLAGETGLRIGGEVQERLDIVDHVLEVMYCVEANSWNASGRLTIPPRPDISRSLFLGLMATPLMASAIARPPDLPLHLADPNHDMEMTSIHWMSRKEYRCPFCGEAPFRSEDAKRFLRGCGESRAVKHLW